MSLWESTTAVERSVEYHQPPGVKSPTRCESERVQEDTPAGSDRIIDKNVRPASRLLTPSVGGSADTPRGGSKGSAVGWDSDKPPAKSQTFRHPATPRLKVCPINPRVISGPNIAATWPCQPCCHAAMLPFRDRQVLLAPRRSKNRVVIFFEYDCSWHTCRDSKSGSLNASGQ